MRFEYETSRETDRAKIRELEQVIASLEKTFGVIGKAHSPAPEQHVCSDAEEEEEEKDEDYSEQLRRKHKRERKRQRKLERKLQQQ